MLIVHCVLDVEELSLLSQRISCKTSVVGFLQLFVLISTVHFLTEDIQLSVPTLLYIFFPIGLQDGYNIIVTL